MAKLRVHELAKEFGIASKAIIDLLKARGEFVRGASSTVEPAVVMRLRKELDARGMLGETLSPPLSVTFADIESGLTGSPYSLPSEQEEYIQGTFLPMVATLHSRSEKASRGISDTGRRALGRINRTSEIYESNRIEGLGPDLAITDQVLKRFSLDEQVGITVAQEAIQRCIAAEPKVRDVVGLGAAKVLAETFCLDTARPLTGSDIRQLHELILAHDPMGGSYKELTNEIQGAVHVPLTPMDARLQMGDLVDWLNASKLSPLWKAAVVHAWLTHIHPFHDGNGRIARLLANLILIRASLPPLIVRASGDRGAYLDALAASDEGGNILPLSRVFRRVLARAAADTEDPNFASRLFEAEIERRFEPLYERWQSSVNAFLDATAVRLRLHRLHMEKIGEVGSAEFARFRKGHRGNVWVAKVLVPGRQQDLLLHIAQPSAANQRDLERDEVFPSIFVSLRSQRPLDAKQYIPVGREFFDYEFTPIVDTGTVLVRGRAAARRLQTEDAGTAVTNHLERIARQLIVR